MACFVAFLRGINVGGKNKVSMSDLRNMCEELALTEVKTMLQSGNVVFDAACENASQLETILEKEATKRFGIEIDFMVRSAADLGCAIRANPFVAEAKTDPGHMVLLFLKQSAGQGSEEALRDAIKGREVVKVRGMEAYAHYLDGIGTSKLTNTVLEKKLGTRVTGRNWNTVTKLHEIIQAR
jgi:uncharacterized protein (DUF1697 family)